MKTVRIDLRNAVSSGRRQGWTKHVKAVDLQKTNGYAFQGPFLPDGQYDLPLGAVVIQKNPCGSVKNGGSLGVCFEVGEEGLQEVLQMDWYTQFLSFRDAVAERLQASSEEPIVDPTTISWQEARRALTGQEGWIPLVKLGDAEHWVRGNRRCVLQASGEHPDKTNLLATYHVHFVRRGSELVPVFED